MCAPRHRFLMAGHNIVSPLLRHQTCIRRVCVCVCVGVPVWVWCFTAMPVAIARCARVADGDVDDDHQNARGARDVDSDNTGGRNTGRCYSGMRRYGNIVRKNARVKDGERAGRGCVGEHITGTHTHTAMFSNLLAHPRQQPRRDDVKCAHMHTAQKFPG